MVSTISTRIIKAEAKANLKQTSFASTTFANHKIPKKKRTSGYSADKDSPASSVCSMTREAKSLRAQAVEENAKRRKIEELNYQASNANRDIQAGVDLTKNVSNLYVDEYAASPHSKIMTSIDKGNVQRIYSNGYDPNNNSLAEESNFDGKEVDYSDLLYSCQHFYCSNGPIPTPSEEETNGIRAPRRFEKYSNHSYSTLSSESGSSSPTPGNDSSGEENVINCISKLFRTKQESKTNKNHTPSTTILKFFCQSMVPSKMTLEDAIESGHDARLVVYTPNEDTEFTVVHCSAAFSRFTGIVSDDLVGQSVEYLFKDTIRIDDNKRTIVTIDMKEANENKVPKSFVLNIIPLEKHSYFYILDFKGLCDTLPTNTNDDNLCSQVVG